jgi:hypothetical protein
MTLNELKVSIEKIQTRIKDIEAECNDKVSSLKDKERDIIQKYVEKNAKYRMGERVLIERVHRYIGWRDINQHTWEIIYRTFRIKPNGEPSGTLESERWSEEHIHFFEKNEK